MDIQSRAREILFGNDRKFALMLCGKRKAEEEQIQFISCLIQRCLEENKKDS
jgi:hypothetical protein